MKAINGQIFVTTREASRLLDVGPRTISRWLQLGQNRPTHAPDLKPLKFPNGQIYFKIDTIKDAYAKSGTNISNEDLVKMLEKERF